MPSDKYYKPSSSSINDSIQSELKKERGELEKALEYIRSRHNILDLSVNRAKVRLNYDQELVFETEPVSNPQGTFNGGGTGNKPIAGVPGFEGKNLTDFPYLNVGNVDLRAGGKGLSFNSLVDLEADGSNVVVMVITETLGQGADATSSVDTFDIKNNTFHIVGNPLNYTGSDNWWANPVTLENIIDGEGSDYDGSFPDAQLIPTMQTHSDGGLPSGVKMPSIWMQIGGSGNEDRDVTVVDSVKFNKEEVIPKF